MNRMAVKVATDMICYIRAQLCSRVIYRYVSQWNETVNLSKALFSTTRHVDEDLSRCELQEQDPSYKCDIHRADQKVQSFM
jgi:hypothetical protein